MSFFSTKGLEEKISNQREQLNTDLKKESRMKEAGMIELVEEDSCDLMEIVKSRNIKEVPPYLRLYWEQQMKQLSKQSSSSYRWQPRYLIRIVDIVMNFYVMPIKMHSTI